MADFNADPSVHGILVQLPMPKHINEQRILDAIDIEKDVDGFHPANIGQVRFEAGARKPSIPNSHMRRCSPDQDFLIG